MTPARYTGALSALALTLVLGACSTPADLDVPTLEPQFGGLAKDYGIDVAVSPKGPIYLLSYEEEVTYEDEYGYVYTDDFSYLSRYDSNGNLIWKVDTEVSLGEYDYSDSPAQDIFTDSQGYVYIVTSKEDYDGNDYSLVKAYDASGKYIRGYYAGCSYSNAEAAVDGQGNLYIACNGNISKLSPAGSQLWKRTVNVGMPTAVTVSSGGSLFIAGPRGVSRISGSNGNILWTKTGAATEVAAVGTNTLYARNLTTVRKFDFSGKLLWSKTQSGLNSMVVAGMTTDTSGNVYLAGKYSPNSPDRNAFTRKLNTSGGVVFTKTFGTSAYDDALGVSTVTGAAIYVTGATKGALAHPFGGGDTDGYVSKLGSTGTPTWYR